MPSSATLAIASPHGRIDAMLILIDDVPVVSSEIVIARMM